MKYIAFLLYIIIWDGGIITGTGYAVFILGASGWWFLLAILLSLMSFKPRHFGIEQKGKL